MLWNLVVHTYDRYNLHHVLILAFLIFYSMCGAFIFVLLEAPHEKASIEADNFQKLRNSITSKKNLIEKIQILYFNETDHNDFYEFSLRRAIAEYDKDMGFDSRPNVNRKWDMWGGLYYAGTIYTTIGYGDLAAVTTGGRLFTMIYAVIGIPMVITILNDWGTLLFNCVSWFWTKYGYRVIKRIHRSLSGRKRKGSSEEGLCDSESAIETTSTKDGEKEAVPLTMVALVLCFWILLCTVVFSALQGWTYFESVYFFFISMTTIGFGDLSPDHKVAVGNFFLILMGLSVVSMSINVVQMQLEILFARIVKGIESDFKHNLGDSGDDRYRTISSDVGDKPHTADNVGKKPPTEDITNKFTGEMNGSDKFLMRFMSNHQKKMLNEKFEDRAKLRNKFTQTMTQIKATSVQTVTDKYEDMWPDEDAELPQQKSRINTRRLYIYNTGE